MLKRKNCRQLTQTCRHSHPHRSQRELRYAIYKKNLPGAHLVPMETRYCSGFLLHVLLFT